MYKIQARLQDGITSNRAKMNYMQIIWHDQFDKLLYSYIAKNKKKEHSNMIRMLSDIKPETRDKFLLKYIARCKLTHALCFF